MDNNTQSSDISEQDFQQLDQFAEKTNRENQLSEILDAVPPLIQRGAIYIIGAALFIMFLILFFGKAHVAVTVKGIILPEGESIQILAMAEGLTTQVLAEEGDHLAKGSPVIRFSHTQSNMDLASMKRQFEIKQNKLKKNREAFQLAEEVLSDPDKYMESGKNPLVSGSTMEAIGTLKISWMSLKKAEQTQKKELKEKLKLMEKEIELAEQNIILKIKNREIALEDLQYQKDGLAVKKQRYEEFLELAERGFYSRVDVDNETERYRTAEMAIVTKEKEIARMELEISNERLGLSEKKLNLKKEEASAGDEYATLRLDYQRSLTGLMQAIQKLREEIIMLEAELKTEEDKMSLTESQIFHGTVVMPHDGIITRLNIHTPGQSIGSGSIVAVMVADNDHLIVKASAKSRDMGFMSPGLPARVKVDAYPFQQFGTIQGRVIKVYPNIGGDGNFTVSLELLENKIRSGSTDIKLSPGLSVNADILTRKQRLIYMLMGKDNKKSDGK